MYPKWIDKMAFSKAHKELLIQLYSKQITRREYDSMVNELYFFRYKRNRKIKEFKNEFEGFFEVEIEWGGCNEGK
ncbi:hypothetical protein ACT7DJ_11700 [Bacillus cereus]